MMLESGSGIWKFKPGFDGKKKEPTGSNNLVIKNIRQLHSQQGHFQNLAFLKVIIDTPIGYFIQLPETSDTFPLMIKCTNSPAR